MGLIMKIYIALVVAIFNLFAPMLCMEINHDQMSNAFFLSTEDDAMNGGQIEAKEEEPEFLSEFDRIIGYMFKQKEFESFFAKMTDSYKDKPEVFAIALRLLREKLPAYFADRVLALISESAKKGSPKKIKGHDRLHFFVHQIRKMEGQDKVLLQQWLAELVCLMLVDDKEISKMCGQLVDETRDTLIAQCPELEKFDIDAKKMMILQILGNNRHDICIDIQKFITILIEQMMKISLSGDVYTTVSTTEFNSWFAYQNMKIQALIRSRLSCARLGHFGDTHFVEHKSAIIQEFRFKNGMRIYFALQGKEKILLLLGSDKGDKNHQESCINRAAKLMT